MPLSAENINSSATTVQQFVANINWAQPTWDLFIVLFFIVAGLIYGLSLGRDRVIVIMISIYMSLAVINSSPWIGNFQADVGLDQFFMFRVSAFVVAFIVLFFLMSRSALLRTVAAADSYGAWWQVMIFSFLHVGLLISVTLSFLPDTAASGLAPLTQKIFVQDTSRFLWIIAPIAAMILFKGGAAEKKSKDDE